MALPSTSEGRRVIDLDDYAFLNEFVHGVRGWLEDYAAIRTMDLLALQERERVDPLLRGHKDSGSSDVSGQARRAELDPRGRWWREAPGSAPAARR